MQILIRVSDFELRFHLTKCDQIEHFEDVRSERGKTNSKNVLAPEFSENSFRTMGSEIIREKNGSFIE
jgi:hypothetical protein